MTNITQFASIWKPRILIAVLIAALVLSFAALYETAKTSGYHWTLAFLWPLLVDGVVLYCVILLAENHRGGVTLAAWLVLIGFDAASIALNAAYGLEISWQASVIHALPAFVAPLVMKLHTSDLRAQEAAKLASEAIKKQQRTAQRKPANKATVDAKPAFGPQNLPAAHEAKAGKIEDRRELVERLWREGLSVSEIADAAKNAGHKGSQDTIRRDIKALQDAGIIGTDGPEIADLFKVVKGAVEATNGNGHHG